MSRGDIAIDYISRMDESSILGRQFVRWLLSPAYRDSGDGATVERVDGRDDDGEVCRLNNE
jgi:hypothetical protein